MFAFALQAEGAEAVDEMEYRTRCSGPEKFAMFEFLLGPEIPVRHTHVSGDYAPRRADCHAVLENVLYRRIAVTQAAEPVGAILAPTMVLGAPALGRTGNRTHYVYGINIRRLGRKPPQYGCREVAVTAFRKYAIRRVDRFLADYERGRPAADELVLSTGPARFQPEPEPVAMLAADADTGWLRYDWNSKRWRIGA